MAKTNMRGSKGGKRGKAKGKRDFKKLGGGKTAGKKSTDKVKIHAVKPRGNQTVWTLQDALRKDGYFARAIGPSKVVTNAPIRTP